MKNEEALAYDSQVVELHLESSGNMDPVKTSQLQITELRKAIFLKLQLIVSQI